MLNFWSSWNNNFSDEKFWGIGIWEILHNLSYGDI
jgi:hypothetical protein